ncbi:protein KRI1 homolog isoform X2 [Oratosquilla oratoria]
MASQQKRLFDENDSDEEDGWACNTSKEGIQINKAYADKYNDWREAEELQKAKDRYGTNLNVESDSETSDDDYVEPENPEFDKDFFCALGALHSKNASILNQDKKFFKDSYAGGSKEKKDKPMTLKDYERNMLLEKGPGFEEGEMPSSSTAFSGQREHLNFKGGDSDEDDDDDGGLLSSGLFTKTKDSSSKSKTEETSKSGNEVIDYLRGEKVNIGDKSDAQMLEGLKKAWNDNSISEQDKWLADFFINKRYMEDEDENVERAYNEAVIDEETLSEDERTFKKMEDFETKYRFRFEEPDEDFIKQYPRVIGSSLRQKDNKRKDKREEVRQRKEAEKERKKQEIQQIKAMKRKEIIKKIEQIKEASGNEHVDIMEDEIDGDFDPEEHNRKMALMFGEDYYGDDADTDKPVFEDDDEDLIRDYDHWMEKFGPGRGEQSQENSRTVQSTSQNSEEYEPNVEDPDFNMDADYDPNQEVMEKFSKKKRRHRSKVAQALERKKPVFDPQEKTFDEYFDEYYKLDFEDIVGGMPCRFKYRKVKENDFGLSTEEILNARDTELNRWYSLKKLLRHDRSEEEEKRDQKSYQHRASLPHVKKKILGSLFNETQEEQQEAEEDKKRRKNLKKKLKRQQKEEMMKEVLSKYGPVGTVSEKETQETGEQNVQETSSGEPPAKKKKKMKKQQGSDADAMEVLHVNTEVTSIESIPQGVKEEVNCASDNENEDVKKDETELQNDEELTPKKKKKKKKKKKQGEVAIVQLKETKEKKKYKNQSSLELQGISDARSLAYGLNPKKLKNKVKYGKIKDTS